MLNLILALPLLWLSACNGDDTTTADSGLTDSGETDTDTDTDADTDTDTDTDTNDPNWAHCPSSDSYGGDGGGGWLEVTATAAYCGGYNEERTLVEEQLLKTQLKLVPGTYALPTTEGTHSMSLPVCTRVGTGVPGQVMGAGGETSVTLNTWSGTTYTYLSGTQPLLDPKDTPFVLEHVLVLVGAEGAEPDDLVADGAGPDANTGSGVNFTLYPDGGSVFDIDAVDFWACDDATWTPESHSVEFDGGDVSLDLVLGINTVQTAPGAFTRAAGTLDGTAFEVTEYFQLMYRPDHHHFGRHFAFVLDIPIGDVCALLVEHVDPLEGDPTAIVSTASCDLTPIEVRATIAETYTYGG
jgi:hypothetical protein